MNKSSIKFLTDFGPLLIFFIVYKKNGNDLSVAIPPLIVATIISVSIVYFIEKKIPFVPLLGAVLVSTFGGLTLYFKNPIFIYIKPTIINILFAIILLVGRYFLNQNFLKVLLNQAFKMDEIGWNKLNDRWAYFFLFLAFLNEVIWRTQTESFWVNFKVWGMLPLTIIFTAAQYPLLNKYKL